MMMMKEEPRTGTHDGQGKANWFYSPSRNDDAEKALQDWECLTKIGVIHL